MGDTKICPFCAEEINAAAIKCKHCGSMMNEALATNAQTFQANPTTLIPSSAPSFGPIPQTIQDGETLRNTMTVSNKPVLDLVRKWAALIGLQVIETTRPNPNTQTLKAKKDYKPKEKRISGALIAICVLIGLVMAAATRDEEAGAFILFLPLGLYLGYHYLTTKVREVYYLISVEQEGFLSKLTIEASAPLDEVRADINQLVNQII